jgi:hypothetical protein
MEMPLFILCRKMEEGASINIEEWRVEANNDSEHFPELVEGTRLSNSEFDPKDFKSRLSI